MAKPVLLTVDDDPEVLRAVDRDLRRRYSENYRVLRAESGATALDILQKLSKRNEPVALLLMDHRMPEMNGIETLSRAMTVFPNARRVLLTAYADTEAAIRAINEVKLNHYLLKPWDPPEQSLYPIIDDLLEDWSATYRPPFSGIRVLGTRWSAKSYDVRDFLARNHVPYQWLDIETAERDPEVRRILVELGHEEQQFPIVMFPEGEHLTEPTPAQLAGRLGLHTQAGREFYDVAIVGGGPAGLAAAVYAASEGLRTVMIEREAPGGQAGLSSRIENYLGFPSGLSGGDLARRAVAQARRFGVEILSPQSATSLRTEGPYRILTLADGTDISCHALLLATGVQWRRLEVPGMDALTGSGVYYGGGSTEAITCKDEDVYIVGGANSAGQAALHFAQYARRVIMLVRGLSLTASMSQYLVDQINASDKVEVRPGTSIVEAHGNGHLEAISIRCDNTNSVERVPASSVFIFIGAEPKTDWLGSAIDCDSRGFIMTGPNLMRDGKRPRGWQLDRDPYLLETNVPGVFAIGDVRTGSVKRVASGVGEGAIAVQFIHQYLAKV